MSPRKDAIYATCRDCGRDQRRIVGRGLCGGCYDRHWQAKTLDQFPRLTRPPKPIPAEKACAICKVVQPLENFGRNNRRPDGRGSYCRPCAQEKYLQPARERNRKIARPVSGTQVCRDCRLEKSVNDFEWRSDAGKFRSWCKDCNRLRDKAYRDADPLAYRDKVIRRKYGIGLAEFDAMVVAQGGGCAICSTTVNPDANSLAVDHCHRTGKVRGILCGRCNKAIGLMDDDPNLLGRAVTYLRR